MPNSDEIISWGFAQPLCREYGTCITFKRSDIDGKKGLNH